MTLTSGSLFAGYGGLALAVEDALGAVPAWVSDVEPAANRILAHRFPGVPNLGDITTVDWATVPRVDVIEGGSPCQDVSAAGKRAGMRAGTRSGLWAAMCDAIDIIRPRLVVWENVRGALSAGADSALETCPICVGDERDTHLRALGRVVGDLSELGYDAAWCGLRAADVGAPHGRYRVFVLGWRRDVAAGRVDRGPAAGDSDGSGGRERGGPGEAAASGRRGPAQTWPPFRGDVGGSGGAAAPDADADPNELGPVRGRGSRNGGSRPADHDQAASNPGRDDSDGDRRESARAGGRAAEVTAAAADGRAPADAEGYGRNEGRPESAGQLGRPHAAVGGADAVPGTRTAGRPAGELVWGDYEPAIRRWEAVTGRPAPAPTELSPRGSRRLSASFVEWLMGLPDGWVCDVPGVSRNDQLKALGNGVVPQQGIAAIRRLLQFVPASVLGERAA